MSPIPIPLPINKTGVLMMRFNHRYLQNHNVMRQSLLLRIMVLAFVFTSLVGCGSKKIQGITFENTVAQCRVEEKFEVKYSISPLEAKADRITWSSSDEKVASVDINGVVFAKEAGTCVISASADGVIASVVLTVKKNLDLEKLYKLVCDPTWATCATDGSYLLIDTNPKNESGNGIAYESALSAVKTVIEKIGLPESLYNDMERTTGLMGKQEETFEEQGVQVSWTYHPNNGLEVTFKELR